jgi:hypothetical protein
MMDLLATQLEITLVYYCKTQQGHPRRHGTLRIVLVGIVHSVP